MLFCDVLYYGEADVDMGDQSAVFGQLRTKGRLSSEGTNSPVAEDRCKCTLSESLLPAFALMFLRLPDVRTHFLELTRAADQPRPGISLPYTHSRGAGWMDLRWPNPCTPLSNFPELSDLRGSWQSQKCHSGWLLQGIPTEVCLAF